MCKYFMKEELPGKTSNRREKRTRTSKGEILGKDLILEKSTAWLILSQSYHPGQGNQANTEDWLRASRWLYFPHLEKWQSSEEESQVKVSSHKSRPNLEEEQGNYRKDPSERSWAGHQPNTLHK